MPQRALLLINPHARQGGTRDGEIEARLRAGGLELVGELREGEGISDAIVRQQGTVDLVIVGGGDGTLNDAIAGILKTSLPLGIIPLGTANDLARTLTIPPDPTAACDIILRGQTKPIDIGQANDCYFFNVASLGLSVAITNELTSDVKQRWGIFAYFVTALSVIFRARPFQAEIRTATEVHKAKTLLIAVGNGRHYGGGLTVMEDAAIDDGLLDLYSVEVKHWWQVLGIMPALLRGTLSPLRQVRTLHGTEFEIRTRRPKAVNTDGELATHTPVTFRVLPQAMRVFVP